MNAPEIYGAGAAAVLIAHLLWISWVMFGAIWSRDRPILAWFHVTSLGWGILAELGPWSCPLTLAEQFFEAKAGVDPYRGAFLVHYLDAMVYPDSRSITGIAGGCGLCAQFGHLRPAILSANLGLMVVR
jgi:hypothetical protein